jgi:hypothetical protein
MQPPLEATFRWSWRRKGGWRCVQTSHLVPLTTGRWKQKFFEDSPGLQNASVRKVQLIQVRRKQRPRLGASKIHGWWWRLVRAPEAVAATAENQRLIVLICGDFVGGGTLGGDSSRCAYRPPPPILGRRPGSHPPCTLHMRPKAKKRLHETCTRAQLVRTHMLLSFLCNK